MPRSHAQSASSYACQEHLGVLNSRNIGLMSDRPTMSCLYPGLTSPYSHGQRSSCPCQYVSHLRASCRLRVRKGEAYKGRPREATCSLHLYSLSLRRRRRRFWCYFLWLYSLVGIILILILILTSSSIVDGGGTLIHKRRFVALRCSSYTARSTRYAGC
jgi:hypothetical protein